MKSTERLSKVVSLFRVAVRTSDESLKWLDWPEYLQTVHELRRECAGRAENGSKRPRSAVAWSLQRYLIFAILSSVPDRSSATQITYVQDCK